MSTDVTSRFLDLARWPRWSTCASPRGTASRAPTAAGTSRGSRAGPASSSISASTPAAKTSAGSTGKCLARTGKAFVRLYQDETNLLCTLAIDASGSMRFGGRAAHRPAGSKLEYVQYLATALTHVISRGQDQVGLAVLDR